MAQLVGKEGDLAIGANAVAETREWSLTINAASIGANSMQSGDWENSKTGRKSWSAEVSCWYDPSDTNGQMAFVEGAEVVCNFYAEGNTTGREVRSGTARVEEIRITGNGENDGLFEFTARLVGVGAITLATVA